MDTKESGAGRMPVSGAGSETGESPPFDPCGSGQAAHTARPSGISYSQYSAGKAAGPHSQHGGGIEEAREPRVSAAGGKTGAVVSQAFFQSSGGAARPEAALQSVSTPLSLTRPLRVVHVGQLMVRAGIEVWLKAMIRLANPERMRFIRCVVTSEMVDPQVAAEMGVLVEVGGIDSVRRAARDCDVMLVSGPGELGEWLADSRPPVCVSVAHGDGFLTREILESCAPILDQVVAVSPRVRQLACNGFATSVIYNGVDAGHIRHSRSRAETRRLLGFDESDYVVGYVGRFSPEKRPATVLQAVANMPPRFKALMVGWGPMYFELLDLANRRLPGRYAFAEATRNLGDYYQAMDAFCLVSHSEGYGLAIMEAMMCERPVIVAPIGFVPEAIEDRVNGVVVDGGLESICGALSLLQRHPDWARSVAREGRNYAEQHGHASRMVCQYEDLFERLWREKSAI